jgi:hypothetical protein
MRTSRHEQRGAPVAHPRQQTTTPAPARQAPAGVVRRTAGDGAGPAPLGRPSGGAETRWRKAPATVRGHRPGGVSLWPASSCGDTACRAGGCQGPITPLQGACSTWNKMTASADYRRARQQMPTPAWCPARPGWGCRWVVGGGSAENRAFGLNRRLNAQKVRRQEGYRRSTRRMRSTSSKL